MTIDNVDVDTPPEKHPALKNFNRTAFQAKYVLGKAGLWGAIGGAVGALAMTAASLWGGVTLGGGAIAAGSALMVALAPLAPLLVGAAAIGLGGLAYFSGGSILSSLFKGLASTAGSALLYVGLPTLAIGALWAMSGAGAAADEEEEKLIADYERREIRQDRTAALRARSRQQNVNIRKLEDQYGLAASNLPRGRGGRGQEGVGAA